MHPPSSSLLPRAEGDGGGRRTLIATGPLTSPPLAEAIRRLAGQDYLSFLRRHGAHRDGGERGHGDRVAWEPVG